MMTSTTDTATLREPKFQMGKALLALLYVHLFGIVISLLFGMLPALNSSKEAALMIVQANLAGIPGVLTTSVVSTLMPFLIGLGAHAIIGGRLNRFWLALVLAVICASVAALQTFALMELIADRPLERWIILYTAGPSVFLSAIWAGLYARCLRLPEPAKT